MNVFYAPTVGVDAETVSTAIVRSAELAAWSGQRNITLLVPQKTNVMGVLDGVLGAAGASRLLKHNRILFGGFVVYLATRRVAVAHNGPLLALWCPLDLVEREADGRYATHLVLVASSADELDQYRRAFPAAAAL